MSGEMLAYPCDRGIKGNVLGRGWHNFVAGPTGVVACTLCGQVAQR